MEYQVDLKIEGETTEHQFGEYSEALEFFLDVTHVRNDKKEGIEAMTFWSGKGDDMRMLREWRRQEITKSGFHWNENGVCTNPEFACRVGTDDTSWAAIQIRVAESPGGQWGMGYSYPGSSCGCSNPVYKTREEALDAGIRVIDKGMRNNNSNLLSKDNLAKLVRKWKKWQADQRQLSLF